MSHPFSQAQTSASPQVLPARLQSRWTKAYVTSLAFGLCLCSQLHADDSIDGAATGVSKAVKQIQAIQADSKQALIPLLQSMKGKSQTVKNWYLSAAQTVADRNPEKSTQVLNEFLSQLSEDADARYWAFRYVTRGKPELRKEILRSMKADPSLELRFEAVQLAMDELKEKEPASDASAKTAYQELLAAARLPSQVQTIAKELEALDVKVDLLKHFGFLTEWKSIGPFDNTGMKNFNTVYGPEKDYAQSLAKLQGATYTGKKGEASWQEVTTDDPEGIVDLSAAFKAEKAAVVYSLGQFNAEDDMACQLRIGSPNGTKVWLNGNLVINREVYHSGSQVDQYVADVKLKKGKNNILVKSCQNEQTEPWAQDFAFQLRFTDDTGYAVQPAN